jgi:hypothetical protein
VDFVERYANAHTHAGSYDNSNPPSIAGIDARADGDADATSFSDCNTSADADSNTAAFADADTRADGDTDAAAQSDADADAANYAYNNANAVAIARCDPKTRAEHYECGRGFEFADSGELADFYAGQTGHDSPVPGFRAGSPEFHIHHDTAFIARELCRFGTGAGNLLLLPVQSPDGHGHYPFTTIEYGCGGDAWERDSYSHPDAAAHPGDDADAWCDADTASHTDSNAFAAPHANSITYTYTTNGRRSECDPAR